jgi:hypothetical protein
MFRHPPRTAERRRLEDRRPVSVAMQPKALAMEGTRPPVISPLERPTFSRGKCMACPTTITLIRHAEKPPKAGTPYGITPDGHQDVNSRTSVGWQRAGGLVSLFTPVIGPIRDSLSQMNSLQRGSAMRARASAIRVVLFLVTFPLAPSPCHGEASSSQLHSHSWSGAVRPSPRRRLLRSRLPRSPPHGELRSA